MKVAEVPINTTFTVKANDTEYRLFREACEKRGEVPSVVIRRMMRRFAKSVEKGKG